MKRSASAGAFSGLLLLSIFICAAAARIRPRHFIQTLGRRSRI